MRRKVYESPESEQVKLFVENSFLTGSNEGAGSGGEFCPPDEMFDDIDDLIII